MPHIEHCHWHLGSVGEIVIADIGGDISIDTGCCGTRYEVGRRTAAKGDTPNLHVGIIRCRGFDRRCTEGFTQGFDKLSAGHATVGKGGIYSEAVGIGLASQGRNSHIHSAVVGHSGK